MLTQLFSKTVHLKSSSPAKKMVPLKTVLFLVAFVSLLCLVTGGQYGGRNSGYGSGSGGYSGYPISVIYPALSHTHSSSLPYQTSLYSYNNPSLSYPTTYPQYYPSHYHSYQPYPLNPLIYTNNDVGYGSGGLFSNGIIPIIIMFVILAVLAPILISSLTMSNNVLYQGK